MTIQFTIPHMDTKVTWANGNATVIIGSNGSGKTLLIKEMMKWCDTNDFAYAHYDAIEALYEVDWYIENAPDDDVIYATMLLARFSTDFRDDLNRWSTVETGGPIGDYKDYKTKVALVRKVLSLAGNGYMRMFLMCIKAIENPKASYFFLDLPEASLHVMIAREIINFLSRNFVTMKIVVATHSPEVAADMTDDYNITTNENIIEL